MKDQIRRRMPYFMLAGLIFIGGIIAFILLLVGGLANMDKMLIRVTAPGTDAIHLEKEGVYTIFLESGHVEDGQVVSGLKYIGGLKIEITGPTGEPIPVAAAKMKQEYNFGSKSGVSIMEFKIAGPGDYQFTSTFVEENPKVPIYLTVSQGFVWRIMRMVFLGLGILMGSILVSVIIVVLAVVGIRSQRTSFPQDGDFT